jgi:hypothetical protein
MSSKIFPALLTVACFLILSAGNAFAGWEVVQANQKNKVKLKEDTSCNGIKKSQHLCHSVGVRFDADGDGNYQWVHRGTDMSDARDCFNEIKEEGRSSTNTWNNCNG